MHCCFITSLWMLVIDFQQLVKRTLSNHCCTLEWLPFIKSLFKFQNPLQLLLHTDHYKSRGNQLSLCSLFNIQLWHHSLFIHLISNLIIVLFFSWELRHWSRSWVRDCGHGCVPLWYRSSMIGVLLVNFYFRVATSSTAGCWAECIIGNGAASGVTELRRLIFLCTTHTIISSFLLCATSHILEVLCKRFLCNMLASWSKVL
jgi:hypothetical protein